MKKVNISILLLSLICSLFLSNTYAQDKDISQPNRELVIATKIAPPFVMKNAKGEYEGISIELWKQMADNLQLNYRFAEAELPQLLQGLEDGSYDASLAAITVTAKREAKIDFTHPFYTTGLAIATAKNKSSWTSTLARFFSWQFAAALLALCLVLLAVGLLLWIFERKKNHQMFGGTAAQGLGSSFWWAAVTMTTVGYGDKAPLTLGGRIVGFIWMFAAIIIISSFTAAIATSLTVSQLASSIESVDDLYGARVSTIDNSASATFLSSISVKYKTTSDLSDALSGLANGKFDAVVYDKPILQYLTNKDFADDIAILPGNIERQDYAIGLPTRSPLREALNEQLLTVIESATWQDIKQKYLGQVSSQ